MQERFHFLSFVFVSGLLGALIYQGIAMAICHWAKLEVLEFRLFYGKPIFKRVIKGTEFALGWIPTGGYVRYDPEAHAKLHLGWRLFLLFGSLVPLAAAGLWVLGWSVFRDQVWTGPFQIIEGVMHPLTVGPALMARVHEVERHSILLAAGLVWAKQTALMLLPVGVLPGGQWLVEILDPARENRVMEVIITGSAPAVIALHVSWYVAILRYTLFGS